MYVPYNKLKRVEWTVEKIIENKNTHIEDSGDFHPVYNYRCMDPSKVNPLKKLEIFPETETKMEMENCVNVFDSQVCEQVELTRSFRETKYFRNKNSSYLMKLTVTEFKNFLGVLLTAYTRVESGINLWKLYWSRKHYFNHSYNISKFSKIWYLQNLLPPLFMSYFDF